MAADNSSTTGDDSLPTWVGQLNDLFLGWFDRTAGAGSSGVTASTGTGSTRVQIGPVLVVAAVAVAAVLLLKS
jgi:hypothetical protein